MPSAETMTPAVAPDADEIAAHAASLEIFTAAAERCLSEGRAEMAAVLVQSAAGVAALRHPGRFADERLEAVLHGAASSLPAVPWTGGEGVLHVLSNALDVGGHTRLAWRWMERDTGRPHSFVVARPAPGATPAPLVAASARTGGREHRVPGFEAGLLATAAALRVLGARFDLLVLHTQPNDPLASLAWRGVADRPPTLLCNHADHCFWLGRDAADVVVGHRQVAADLAVARRGIPRGRTATLALPLDERAATTPSEREAARERIGIPARARLLLTIGSSYKFQGGDEHLLDPLLPLLHEDPSCVLIAVGPPAEGRWTSAAQATGGRVLATGVLPDVGDLLAAADVFVESYPCSSGTAVVEAAQRGLPVVAYAPDETEAVLLGSAGAAAGLWVVARSAVDLCDRVREAVANLPALEAHHHPDAWRDALHAAEDAARTLGPVRPVELGTPPADVDRTDVVLHRLHARAGHRHAAEVVQQWEAQARALAAWPQLARCFVPSLAGATTHLELARCFDVAVAAPGPGEEAVAVDALRTLVHARLAASGVIVVHPDRVDEVFPRLEAALAAGAEVDLDVTPSTCPADHLFDGVLAVRTAADGFADDVQVPVVDAHRLGS